MNTIRPSDASVARAVWTLIESVGGDNGVSLLDVVSVAEGFDAGMSAMDRKQGHEIDAARPEQDAILTDIEEVMKLDRQLRVLGYRVCIKSVADAARAEQIESRYFLSGPNASCVIFDKSKTEQFISAMALMTGDDPDDYTCTDLQNPTGKPAERAEDVEAEANFWAGRLEEFAKENQSGSLSMINAARVLRRLAAEQGKDRKDSDKPELLVLTEIRWAIGDNGKRMQDELVAYISELAKDADRYRYLREWPNNISQRFYGGSNLLRRDQYLDESIDAAMAQEAGNASA